tara:strand:+ start:1491 stop:1781 length:291 start_codon:yes stop_codon:yes gene_type:complete
VKHRKRLNFAVNSKFRIALVAHEAVPMVPFPMSIEKRIARGLERLQCGEIVATHLGGGKISLECTNQDANERAIAIAATKTVPGVTEVSIENGKLS